MSEDFDKEAEREKLREKFAAEEEDRKATQQMSELLLRGATMTNQHCPNCGDPIFRHDGQEFCPTCQGAGGQAQQAGGQAQQAGGQAQQAGSQAQQAGSQAQQAEEPRQGSQQAPQGQQERPEHEQERATTDQETADASEATADAADADESPRSIDVRSPEEVDGDERQSAAPPEEREGQAESSPAADHPTVDPGRPPESATASERSPESRRAAAGRPGAGDDRRSTATPAAGEGDARANLQRSLDRFAAMAAETDDPREARECLAAAREAAAALAELRR